MKILLQVSVINEDTGEVEKTYVEAVGERTHPWEAAQAIRRFLDRVFGAVFGESNDEW